MNLKKIIENIEILGSNDFRVLREKIDSIITKKRVSNYLETEFDELECPTCKSKNINRWGKRSDMQRYRCKKCKRTFNSLTNTSLARLRRKGHWIEYAECIKEGLTIREAALICGIHKNTSFRWRHRFIGNYKKIKAKELKGIVEFQESDFKVSFKGAKKCLEVDKKLEFNLNSHVSLIVGYDRNDNVFDDLLNGLTIDRVENSIKRIITKDSLFCSFDRDLYKLLAQSLPLRHGTLNENKGEKIKKNVVHIKNVDNYNNRFKEWIYKHFKGVATKYLQNYVGWFRSLNEFEDEIKPLTLLLRSKNGGKYKYQPLKWTSGFFHNE